MGGMGGMRGGGSGGGEQQRKTPGYIKGQAVFGVPGENLPPAVIGEDRKKG
jgi:hypothetical protein